jgi:hypothetical protein
MCDLILAFQLEKHANSLHLLLKIKKQNYIMVIYMTICEQQANNNIYNKNDNTRTTAVHVFVVAYYHLILLLLI